MYSHGCALSYHPADNSYYLTRYLCPLGIVGNLVLSPLVVTGIAGYQSKNDLVRDPLIHSRSPSAIEISSVHNQHSVQR